MIDTYRTALESFHEQLTREHYLHFAGYKPTLDLAPIYSEFSDLYRLETISSLRTAIEAVPSYWSSKKKSYHRLLAFALEQYLESKTRSLTESIAEAEARAKLTWDGREVRYFDAFALLANEPDWQRRRELYRRRSDAVSSLVSDRRKRLRIQSQTVRDLGFESYRALCSFTKGLDYEAIARRAARFLLETRDLYEGHLRGALRRELQLDLAQAHRSDIAFFQRLTRYDESFPAHRMMEAYGETLAHLGVELTRQNNLQIDADPRPGKRPRAFCAPIVVPSEIKLVISPLGGHDDYAAFLHEGGHAQHYAWTSPNLPVENRCCGDLALSEVYAFLFNYLMADSGWLLTRQGLTGTAEFVYLQHLFRLYYVRRYAAKVLFEVELHKSSDSSDDAVATRYAELLSDATLFRFEASEYLEDLDDGFYAADYFRAWLIEAQLEEYLRHRYARNWHTDRQAGRFLKEIWETGESYTADELSQELGLRSDDIFPLENDFRQALTHGYD